MTMPPLPTVFQMRATVGPGLVDVCLAGDVLAFAHACEADQKRLKSVGGQFANVAYNWSQHCGRTLTGDDVAMLDSLRKQWDAATKGTT